MNSAGCSLAGNGVRHDVDSTVIGDPEMSRRDLFEDFSTWGIRHISCSLNMVNMPATSPTYIMCRIFVFHRPKSAQPHARPSWVIWTYYQKSVTCLCVYICAIFVKWSLTLQVGQLRQRDPATLAVLFAKFVSTLYVVILHCMAASVSQLVYYCDSIRHGSCVQNLLD